MLVENAGPCPVLVDGAEQCPVLVEHAGPCPVLVDGTGPCPVPGADAAPCPVLVDDGGPCPVPGEETAPCRLRGRPRGAGNPPRLETGWVFHLPGPKSGSIFKNDGRYPREVVGGRPFSPGDPLGDD